MKIAGWLVCVILSGCARDPGSLAGTHWKIHGGAPSMHGVGVKQLDEITFGTDGNADTVTSRTPPEDDGTADPAIDTEHVAYHVVDGRTLLLGDVT